MATKTNVLQNAGRTIATYSRGFISLGCYAAATLLIALPANAAGVDPEDGFLMCGPYGFEVTHAVNDLTMTLCEQIELMDQEDEEEFAEDEAKDARIAELENALRTRESVINKLLEQKNSALRTVKALKRKLNNRK